MVRYWGNEWGNRKFEIWIDEQRLLVEDNTGRWSQSKFQKIEYAIPNTMVKGRDHIRVKFQPLADNTAGAVYSLRLVRAENMSRHHEGKN
jgi:hypothetical protein